MGLSATSSHPEFLDEVMVGACSRFSKMELPVAATLLLELHGSRHGLAEQQRQTGRDDTGTGMVCHSGHWDQGIGGPRARNACLGWGQGGHWDQGIRGPGARAGAVVGTGTRGSGVPEPGMGAWAGGGVPGDECSGTGGQGGPGMFWCEGWCWEAMVWLWGERRVPRACNKGNRCVLG